MTTINPNKAFFIKLGSGGRWEQDCITKDNTIRLGFASSDHADCLNGDWEKIRDFYLKNKGKIKGKATEIKNEIRHFYESDENTLWVTFYANRLWWCFAEKRVKRLSDGSKIRKVIGQWHDTDIHGSPLSIDSISGNFSKVRRFQGTICSVDEQYIINKINGKKPIEVVKAEQALEALKNNFVPLIQQLTPKDFELLVDLVFSNAGWQRVSVLGKTEKDLDLDLISPVTKEKIFVQVKSSSTAKEFKDYSNRFSQTKDFTKLFYIVHTPDKTLLKISAKNNIHLIFVEQLADLVVSSGLSDWLIKKNS